MRRAASVLAAAFALSAAALPEAVFDRGGVTFDFAAASARRFNLDVPDAANLVKGDRAGGAGFECTVALPDDRGGPYVLSCRYRMTQPADYRHEAHSNGGCRLLFDKGGRRTEHFLVAAGDWYPFMRTVSVPKGATSVKLQMSVHKDGTLAFKDLAFAKAPPRPELEIVLAVQSQLFMDYALPQGQCAMLSFCWRKSPEAKFDPKKLSYRITLPKGVEFVDTACGDPKTVRTETRPDGSTVTTFAKRNDVWISTGWDMWGQRGILVRSAKDAPLGPCGKGSVVVLHDGKPLAGTGEIAFFGVPPIAPVKAPKRYFNGVDYGGNGSRRFNTDAARAEYARFLADCGVRGIISQGDDRRTRDILHAAGVKRLLSSPDQCRNGYMLAWEGETIPGEIRFVSDEDAEEEVKKFAVCPIAVYEECDWFRNVYVPRLNRLLDGADGMWANWEPYMFINRGCFCERCRRAFAEYARISEAELAKVWPKKVAKTYRKQWENFRSREHGRLIRTIDRYVTAATGASKSLGFVPGVEWSDMGCAWRDENLAAQYRMIDYAGDLRWIEPWGPYAAWESDKPYFYLKYRPLAQFFGAADIRRQVDRDYPKTKRPKLMSYPHGVQNTAWITQPESLAMALDAYFFHGWEASMVYFFPKGCDARWWRPYAAATARAGKYEDFVLDGRDVSASVSATPVREYAVPCAYATRYVPWSRDASLLQMRAYEKDGTRVVAAFNFWQKGEAFFDLKVQGLKGDCRIVDEDGVLYVRDDGRETWSAAELAAGVRLAVGAMRTKVFEIVPASRAAAPRSVMTRARLDAEYEARRPALAAEAAEDARYEKANPTPPRDYMPMI